MKTFAWLALPVSAALLTACGGTAPAPGKLDQLSTPTALELQSQAQGTGSFSFKNTGGSALSYSTVVSFPNGTPAWLNITKGAGATVQAGASQTVEFRAVCPNVASTTSYMASIALTVGSGSTAITKTASATLKCLAGTAVATDAEKPVLTATSLSSVGVPRVIVTGSATDNVGVTRVTYSLNGGSETDVDDLQAGSTVALNFTVQGLVASNTIVVRAYDAANNVSDSQMLSVAYASDAVAPAITATVTPAVSQGVVTVTGRIADELGGSGVKTGSATYTLTDAASNEIDTDLLKLNADGSFSLLLDGLAQHHYTLTISAADNNDNTDSKTFAFKVDTTRPEVTLSSVMPKSNSFTAAGSASDAFSGLATVTYEVVRLDGSKEVVRSGNATLTTGSGYSFSEEGLEDGSYTVRLIATDHAGNAATSSKSITLSKDGPLIVLNEILPNNGSFTFSGSISDFDLDLASPAYSLTNKSGTIVKQGSLSLSGGKFNQSVTGLTEGTYTLMVSAKDTSENKNSSSLVVEITVDSTAPVIANLEATPTRKNKSIVKTVVTFTATDDVEVGGVEYKVDDGSYKNIALSSAGTYLFSFSNKPKAGSKYTVTVRVTDTAGNSTTQTKTVTAP